MSATGSFVCQAGLIAMCKANSTVMSIATAVYDAVPEDAVFPFIVVGEGEETDASSFGEIAHDLFPDIQIWDKDGETLSGNASVAGFKRAESCADAIVAALDNNELSVTGHSVIVLDPRNAVDKSRPGADDPSLRLVQVRPHILLEDS